MSAFTLRMFTIEQIRLVISFRIEGDDAKLPDSFAAPVIANPPIAQSVYDSLVVTR